MRSQLSAGWIAFASVFFFTQEAPALALDDFDTGPTAAIRVKPDDANTTGNSEQSGLDTRHVIGGVRQLSIMAPGALGQGQVAVGSVAPFPPVDGVLVLSSDIEGRAVLLYDAIAGSDPSSGSDGALDLDASSHDAILVEVAQLAGTNVYLQLDLWDGSGSKRSGALLAEGTNRFDLSDFSGLDLSDIRQIRLEIRRIGAVPTIITDISFFRDPAPGSGLPAPELLTPSNGGMTAAAAPQFTWTPVSGATGYRIAVSTHREDLSEDPGAPACSACSFEASTAAPAQAHAAGLPASTVHWWRVQALPAGTWSDARVFTTNGSVAIQITDPESDAFIGADSAVVRGLVTPPPETETGIEINGIVALSSPTEFGATVPLSEMVHALVATARDASGAVVGRHAIPIHVDISEEELPIRFSVAPEMGTTPHLAQFGFTSRIPLTLVTLDADGNGTPDHAGENLSDFTFAYAAPGFYEPIVSAVAEDGITYKASAFVRVYSSAELDLLLIPKWQALKAAIRSGNVSAALEQLLLRRRAEYTGILNDLIFPMAEIDEHLTELVFDDQIGGNVHYEMLRTEDGTLYSYPVVFAIDEDGVWRLSAF